MNEHDFGWALNELKAGNSVFRADWNGPGQRLSLQSPDENSKMMLSYIYIETVRQELVPWSASSTDLLAVDWGIAA